MKFNTKLILQIIAIIVILIIIYSYYQKNYTEEGKFEQKKEAFNKDNEIKAKAAELKEAERNRLYAGCEAMPFAAMIPKCKTQIDAQIEATDWIYEATVQLGY